MAKTVSVIVNIGLDDGGRYTAYSTAEPIFCFVRESEDAARNAARAAIRSYLAVVLRQKVDPSKMVETEVHPVPVRRLQPTSSFSAQLEMV